MTVGLYNTRQDKIGEHLKRIPAYGGAVGGRKVETGLENEQTQHRYCSMAIVVILSVDQE